MRWSIAPLLVLLPLILLPGPGNATDLDRGRALAERWCGNCHIVDRTASAGRADGLPTFPAIAARSTTTEASLRGVMSAPHGRMPDRSRGARDQDDLIAYILSLRQN
jgi:mono/diheme cytochrome c family protein